MTNEKMYIVLYGKLNKYGNGDIDIEFDRFDSKEEAIECVNNIKDYVTSNELTGWGEVRKGDYLAFVLDDDYINIAYNELKDCTLKDSLGHTNK